MGVIAMWTRLLLTLIILGLSVLVTLPVPIG